MCRFLFRTLALLLAIMLPLRLMAAGIAPIVGAPGHAHLQDVQIAAHAHGVAGTAPQRAHGSTVAQADAHDAAQRGCAAHAAAGDQPADALHEHGCPHLGMAGISAPVPPRHACQAPPRIDRAVSLHYVSIVLDVPSPPPTARG